MVSPGAGKVWKLKEEMEMEWGMISGKKSQLWNFLCTVLWHLVRGFPSSSISRLWCYAQFHIH